MQNHSTRRATNASTATNPAGSTVLRAFCLQLPDAVEAGQAPEWIPYLPAPDASGRITGEDGRWWVLKDAKALCAAVKRKLPIDINHSTEIAAKTGGESPAAGWMHEFQVREDGSTWAKAKWNARGSNALAAEEYGFVSPTFDFDAKTRVITRLVSAALLNEPNFTSLALNGQQNPEDSRMTLEQLLALLGLSATASLDDATRAINALKAAEARASNAPDLTRYVPRSDHDLVVTRATNAEAALAKVEEKAKAQQIDSLISDALKAGKITPASEPTYRAMCAREGGIDTFTDLMKVAPVIVGEADRARNAPEASADGLSLTDSQRAICANTGIEPKAYAASLKALTPA